MMIMKKRNLKLNLSRKSKTPKNGFVHIDNSNLESFKNKRSYSIIKKIQPRLQNAKRFFKSILEKPRLWTNDIDWKENSKLILQWFVEVLIEGVMANWSSHKLLGLEFGIGMIIAHGFLIKQILDLYRRLKNNGETAKLVEKG